MKKISLAGFMLIILFLFCSCGQAKSINTTINNEIKFQLSAAHFVFYSCDKDKKCLKDLSDTLNDNYERILNDLGVTLYGKVAVYIYPNINTYHKEINRPNAPNWSVGSTRNNNTILMVSPLNPGGSHSYKSMVQAAVHEFTHVVVGKINPDLESMPTWLDEGTASFESNQMDAGIKKDLKDELQKNHCPTLADLGKDSITFGNEGGYEFSYTIVEYIVKDYGYDKLRNLIKSPKEFQNVFGISEDEFQKRWINYLNENYK